MADASAELDYYRAIEDRFAALRGVPHVLSPKDFQLMRSWWRDGVPLAAITSAMTEVFARRRERRDAQPIVSLGYCRHAVAAHTRRLAEAHTGATNDTVEVPVDSAVIELASRLRSRSQDLRSERPAVAEAVARVAGLVEVAVEQRPAALDEHLFALETVLLDACWEALDDDELRAVEGLAAAAGAGAATDDARSRTLRAVRDRELRRLLALPRLELP